LFRRSSKSRSFASLWTTSGSLPVDPHEGLTPVVVTDELPAGQLVTGDLRATILRIALPAVASTLLMTLFASVDAYWVGTRIGSAALAAVSTSLFYIWMMIALAEMVGVGLTAVAARRWGEGRGDEARRIAGDAIVFSVLLGCVVSGVGRFWIDELFAALHTPAEVTALGKQYLSTYLLAMPLVYGFFAIDASFRAAGDTRTPLVLLAVSVGCTLVLDPVLMLGLFGMPALGIKGAAIATTATRGAVFAMGATIAIRRNIVRLGRVRAASLWAVCRIGLPTAVTGIAFSVIYVLLTRTTTRFGTPALAALGIGHRVESWLFMVGVGFGAATAAIVGQNIGAGRLDRARRAAWIGVGYCTVLGLIAFAFEVTIPERFASLFSNDPLVIAEASKYLRIAAISQLAICAELVLDGALGGAGHTVAPMLYSTAMTAARIPLAAWAADRWGSTGIWWVIALTAVGRGVALVALWAGKGWERRKV
jgi:putative MATE family efflux protein